MIKKGAIFLSLLISIFFAFSVNAQVKDADISIVVSPEYPAPNENTTITINSFSVDLNKSFISWSVDNIEISSGVGKKSLSINSGNKESSTSVKVTIDMINGQRLSKSVLISPREVDLLWEAYDVYTPPFYKGKALVPKEGSFKIVAMPQIYSSGQNIKSSNLSYIWKMDGTSNPDSSGWGKDYLIFKLSILDQNNEASVLISDVSGKIKSENKVKINTYNPKILFYENDPILGINYSKAITNGFKINESGKTLVAEPYFFSNKNMLNNLQFSWSINNKNISTPNPQNTLTLKPDSKQSGSAFIDLSVKNPKTLFQNINQRLNVSF